MKIPQKPPSFKDLSSKEMHEIFKLKRDKEIQEFIKKNNAKYVHWDELRYKKIPKNVEPKQIWFLLKFARTPHKHLEFDNQFFSFFINTEIQKSLHQLDKNAGGSLEAETKIPKDKRIILNSLIDEAIASSQIEGAATSTEIAKDMLGQERKPKTISEKMILNNYLAMQEAEKMRDIGKLTLEKVLDLHKIITKDTLKDKQDEGRLRTNNKIKVMDDKENVLYTPPDYKKINALLTSFFKFANENDEDDFIHPIVKGIILHFMIGYIHPFRDGNGRTARIIFYWYVLKNDYGLFENMAISKYILRAKAEYGYAYLYTETDENDLTYFINYNMSKIMTAFQDMQDHIKKQKEDTTKILSIVERRRDLNLRQGEIIKKCIEKPQKKFSIGEIQRIYAVAYDTARNDLLHLEKKKYLKRIKIGKKYLFGLNPNSKNIENFT